MPSAPSPWCARFRAPCEHTSSHASRPICTGRREGGGALGQMDGLGLRPFQMQLVCVLAWAMRDGVLKRRCGKSEVGTPPTPCCQHPAMPWVMSIAEDGHVNVWNLENIGAQVCSGCATVKAAKRRGNHLYPPPPRDEQRGTPLAGCERGSHRRRLAARRRKSRPSRRTPSKTHCCAGHASSASTVPSPLFLCKLSHARANGCV